MRAFRAFLGVVTLSLLAAFPGPLAAQIDLTVDHKGLAIGDVPRVIGVRLNYRDRRLERVDGINATIWSPYEHGSRGLVRGVALGVPVTGADRIDGVGIGILGVGAQDRFRGIGIGAAGVGSGGDLEGLMIGGLGVGSGHDITGIGVGGLGIGSSGTLRGAFVGGFGAGSGADIEGIVVGGLGAGASGDMTGIVVGGLGAGARNVRGALVSAGWTRLEHGTLNGFSMGAFNQLKGVQHGLAIGIVNYAEELHGVQVGLINIARNNSSATRILPIVNVNLHD